MTLRKKTIILIGVTGLALIVMLYAVAYLIVMGSFRALEAQNMREHVERVVGALSKEVERIASIAGDYAPWDDSYQFMQDGNQSFIDVNFVKETFLNLRVNLFVYLNVAGQVVFVKAIDLESGEQIAVPEKLQAHLQADSPLLHLSEPETKASGLILLPDGPMIVASHPILTSVGQGPIQGILIAGRYLDISAIQLLAETLQLSLSIFPISSAEIPGDVQDAIDNMAPDEPIIAIPLNSRTIAGYTTIDDLYGSPCLAIRVDSPRSIVLHGQSSLRYLAVSLLVSSAILGGIMLVVLERVVLARLTLLDHELAHIRKETDLSRRVGVVGHDELSHLGGTINNMLTALEQSQADLRTHHDHLEELVHNRTHELMETNERLRQEIAERQRIAEELQRAKEAAEAANRAKSTFLANMSHELRTPLNGILGYAQLLSKSSTFPEQYQKAIHIIWQSGEHLLLMINDILDLTKIEAQKIVLQPREFFLPHLLKKLVAIHELLAEEKQLTFEYHLAPTVPPLVYGDERRLRQILRNLLSNAIKFTKQGGVTFRVSSENDLQSALLRFEVIDTGVGIPPERLETIFEAFNYVDDQHLYSYGPGIGLSLSQRLAHLMGGRLYVESTVKKGSTFRLEIVLPFAASLTNAKVLQDPEELEILASSGYELRE
ncbi:multi-sensor hybrid histidine kinase [Candidatus Vecturithrix granuli]|uniref:histidine kinase n=1 Tax=Vecturithrix granuli TaxID=1499967 RepID=A0A081C4R1_VECG1|nr:multi-sensor hybrid histidine kinase [Candidatus Vecturithrix granuli]